MSETYFTCSCCGHRTLDGPPDSHQICQVCFWQDDGLQLLDPARRGGANSQSLMEGQTNFARFGASQVRFVESVRPPEPWEVRDPEWRPAQEGDALSREARRSLSQEERERPEYYYYWKRTARNA